MRDQPLRFDPEALVAQTRWVRALARSLVRPDRVDDVVQEALLAALERPPRAAGEPGRLRAWLAVVARNAALGSARSERRRRERETAAARPEAAEAAGRIVERTALHARVVQAVLALEEPCRTTVLMRYFDGLSSAAIARRLGVPDATVRQRLARGLRRLRAELVDEHGSCAELALLLWPPWLLAPPARAVVAKAAVAVACAVLLVGVTWQLRSATASERLQSSPLRAGLIAPVASSASGTVSVAKPSAPDRASVAHKSVTVRVVDGRDLHALPGVAVSRAVGRDRTSILEGLQAQWRTAGIRDSAARWVYLSGEPAIPPAPGEGDRPPFAPDTEHVLGSTDAAGSLELTDELPEGGALVVRHASYAPRYIAAADLPTYGELVLHLLPQASLRVRVVNESHEPVPDAWLRVDRAYPPPAAVLADPSRPLIDQVMWHGPTDGSGSCRIEGLPTGWLIYVTALGELCSEARELVLAPGEVERELMLYVERPGTVSGRLVFPDESPVAGVGVHRSLERLTSRFGGSTVTDEEGRLELRDVAAGPGWLQFAGINTVGNIAVDVIAGSHLDLGAIVLPRPERVRGRVISDDLGRLCWKMSRAVGPAFGGQVPFPSTGTFTLVAPAGEAVLHVSYDDREWGRDHEVLAVPLTFPSEDVEIRIPTLGGVLRGQLPEPTASSTRVDVRLHSRDGAPGWRPHGELGAGCYGVPLVDGTFECRFLAGRYAIEVQVDASTRTWIPSVQIEAGATTDLGTLVLAPARLSGMVRSASGLPVAGAKIEMKIKVPDGTSSKEANDTWGNERVQSLETRAAEDGRFELVGVGAGVWSIRANAGAELWSAAETLELLPGEERVVELAVASPARVRGRASRAGLPAPGWPVSWSYDLVGVQDVLRPQIEWNATSLVMTDRDGRFELAPFEPGFYAVRLGSVSKRFELRAGETVELDFEESAERARVRLTSAGKELHLGLLYALQSEERSGFTSNTARPLGAGWFELGSLHGQVLLFGSLRGSQSLWDTSCYFALVEGERLTDAVEVPVAPGALDLRLTGPLRHAARPTVRLLSIGPWNVERALAGSDLAHEDTGPDGVRYLSIPSGSKLLVEGLGSDGRTLRREIQYEGPEPLALDWPGDAK